MQKQIKIFGAIILFNFLGVTTLYSFQVDDSIEVKSSSGTIYVGRIVLAGNETTKDEVILREMRTKEGKPLNVEVLERDLQNIYNTGLFTKIDVTPVPLSNDSINLIITVEESFYLIPVPQGGIKEGDLDKIWAGLKVRWRNFRGMNETLGLSFGIFYEPFVNASYSNPWMGSDKYFLSTSIGYAQRYIHDIYYLPPGTIVDKDTVPKYSSESFDVSGTFGRYINPNLSVSSTVGYSLFHAEKFIEGRTLTPDGQDTYLSVRVSSNLDTRDLFSYPSNGALGSLELTKYGFGNHINFNRFSIDARKYIPIIPFDGYTIIFASRVVNSISWGGNIPPYLKEQFGYGETIRGWSGTVFEGDSKLGGFAEFRFPIIKPNYIEGKDIPLIKKISLLKNLSYKYGLYFTTFYDVGGVWDKKDNFFNTQFRSGYGVGLNAILPFNFVGRMDLCFSKRVRDEYYIELDFGLSASF